MTAALLSSKVRVREEPAKILTRASRATAVLAVVGVTERGPVGGLPTTVTSYEEFEAVYGSFLAGYFTASCVRDFFRGGGREARISRLVHYDTDVKTSAAAGSISILDRHATTPVATLSVTPKYDGTYINGYKINITAATSGDTDEFNLEVQTGAGAVVEIFRNLTMVTTDAKYAITEVNRDSRWITLTDSNSATATPLDLPAIGLTAAFAAGADGVGTLAVPTLVVADFVGTAALANGVHAFDQDTEARLLMVPDLDVPLSDADMAGAQASILSWCEVDKAFQLFFIVDPPAGKTASDATTGVITWASGNSLLERSEMGALYWPRVKILNPNKSVYGIADTLTVPACGMIAARYARNDAAQPGGIYEAPAGVGWGELVGAVDVETTEVNDEGKRDLILPKRINPIVRDGQIMLDGARCLKSTGNFPTVGERRGVIYIEQTIAELLRVYRHRRNTERLRDQVEMTITSFLLEQMDDGAFASNNAATAFFVDVGTALNTPAAIAAGLLKVRVGLATAKPAEFIDLAFSQDVRAQEAALAASLA